MDNCAGRGDESLGLFDRRDDRHRRRFDRRGDEAVHLLGGEDRRGAREKAGCRRGSTRCSATRRRSSRPMRRSCASSMVNSAMRRERSCKGSWRQATMKTKTISDVAVGKTASFGKIRLHDLHQPRSQSRSRRPPRSRDHDRGQRLRCLRSSRCAWLPSSDSICGGRGARHHDRGNGKGVYAEDGEGWFARPRQEVALHPYYDDLGDDVWLVARVVERRPTALRFGVEVPAAWSPVMAARVLHHFRSLGLAALYASEAAEELINIRHSSSR
jgi:hypothetical protein